MSHTVQTEINGGPFSIETGKVAKQADGAVVVRYGGTMVLATCVTEDREGSPGLLPADGRVPRAHVRGRPDPRGLF